MVLFATFMSFMVLGGCVYTTGVVHAILLERFGENNATTAWVVSLFCALTSLAGKVSLLTVIQQVVSLYLLCRLVRIVFYF